MSNPDDICAALRTLRSRLNTLASINATNITVPGGPQARYHQIIEEAYAAYSLIETEVDALGQELEYQHKRLDDLRDGGLAGQLLYPSEPTQGSEQKL